MAAESSSPGNQGMRAFMTVWLGQLVSLVGSALTSFAVGVWVIQQTGQVTQYSWILLASTLPSIVLAPMAGVFVDRHDRRLMLMLSDLGGAAVAIALAVLFFSHSLLLWHLYVLLAVGSAFRALQLPAYLAATSLLVPREHLARVAGANQTAQALSMIGGPLIAGALLAFTTVDRIILLDVASFLISLLTLAIVRIPQPAKQGAVARPSMWQEIRAGWQYMSERAGLVGLLVFFALLNLSLAVAQSVLAPMVLAFTTAPVLGTITAVSSLGMLAGGIAVSVTGGPKRRIHGVLAFTSLFGVGLLLAGIRPWPVLVAVGFAILMLCVPFITASSTAIWQTKTPAHLQGRVFAIRQALSWSCLPLGYLLAGPLADRVFSPLLLEGGAAAGSLGPLFGVGAGRGYGLLIAVIAVLLIAGGLLGYAFPRLRNVETDLADQELTPQPQASAP